MGRARSKQTKVTRTASQAAPRRTWDWRLTAFLGAVFLVKLVVLSQLQHHPLLSADSGLDTESYIQLARRALGGDLALGPGLYYASPLYIYFLAACLWISDSLTAVRLVQIALGTAAVACVFETAREWSGRRAAWIAAVLAALTGPFTFYEILIHQAALDTFLTAAALLFLTRALVASDFRRKTLLAGIFFGLLILNRPNAIVAVAGVTLTLLIVRRARVAMVIAAGVLAALAPVVLRNAIVSRQFALVSSQGGLNLYIGNNAAATGQYVPVPGIRANIEGQSEDTRRVAEQAQGRALTDAQVSAHFTNLATAWIRQHPAAAAKLFARKLALVFNARHQWLDFSYPYYAHDTGSILALLIAGPWLLVPLGVTGLVIAAPARRTDYCAWAAFVPAYAIGVAIFFVAERYRLPIFVPLCVAAGGGVTTVAEWIRNRHAPRRRTLVATAAVFLAAVICTSWSFGLTDGRFEERLRLAKVLMNRGDHGAAAMELERAHAIRPDDSVTEFNLGMALLAAGRVADGIARVRHAVDAGVPVNGARYALANAMLASGDAAGATALLRTYSPAPEDNADSCYQVGVLGLRAGAPDVAERYLVRALSLRPGWAEAEQALAEARAR